MRLLYSLPARAACCRCHGALIWPVSCALIPCCQPSSPQIALPCNARCSRNPPTGTRLVPLHQDLGIPVEQRIAHAELSCWSVKEGVPHVHAPHRVLEQIAAV